MGTRYIIAYVREDLPSKEQALVQCAHAGIEAGIYFGRKTAEPYTLLVYSVPTEEALKERMATLEYHEIQYRAFVEPDQNHEFTALATEPITKKQRKHFKNENLFSFTKRGR